MSSLSHSETSAGAVRLRSGLHGRPRASLATAGCAIVTVPTATAGDLAFDPLGLKPEDPAEFRAMQEKELSHGRLAMLAAAGFMAQEAVTGDTWGNTDIDFDNLIFGAWFAKEAAVSSM